MQVAVREFVRAYNQRHEATVLLTSHYMDDVVALCPRVIVIDKGRLRYDGDLRALVRQIHPEKLVSFRVAPAPDDDALARLGALVSREADRITLRVPQARVREVVGHLLGPLAVTDLDLADPPLEDVMRQLFVPPPPPAAAPAAP
jgi:ABC-2 type transport system ATP-binding protein